MAWTVAAFKTAYPELATATDHLVQRKLDEAGLRCDARVFGDRHDDAVGLLAAHLISLASGGQHARLESDKAETTYGAEWARLARQCAGGPWAIGQRP